MVLLGTYVPRQCGIATFTADLAGALSAIDTDLSVDAIALSDRDDYEYAAPVRLEILQGDQASYRRTADFINDAGYDVVSVQHEYGIFGGDSGSYLLSLLRETKMPIVTTLHTVLRQPSAEQKLVMDELLQLSDRVVVMSETAVRILNEVHGTDPEKVDLIPHGIPEIPQKAAAKTRKALRIKGPMILTFGLLSPDKGIEYVIEAMPRIVRECPGATYVVVGATHPHVRSRVGEVYREGLVARAKELGVEDSVRFVDRFVTKDELVGFLGATDVYVTPYLKPNQITSGTLAYAVGAGKAVISTPYWYAEELLDSGRGLIVPFRDSDAISDAVILLQNEPEEARGMARRAADYGENMRWPQVARKYLATFARAKLENAENLRTLVRDVSALGRPGRLTPELDLNHVAALTDDTGILQHAKYSVPNRSEGYCVDDNARALLLTAYLESCGPLPDRVRLLQSRYMSFVSDAFNPQNGRFRNFMTYQREWLESSGSEDSHGRALWSLGAVIARTGSESLRKAATDLFDRAAPAVYETTSPRTWAYAALAANERLNTGPSDHRSEDLLRRMAGRIWRQLEAHSDEGWTWFEDCVTYANARLPQAIIVAAVRFQYEQMLEAGLESLSWLVELQTDAKGRFAPIGSDGFLTKGGQPAKYDQQPIEAAVTVSACLSAAAATGDSRWQEEAERAFQWFLGKNLHGQPLYDSSTGGCHDGLGPQGVNLNEGAESTLSYLCARIESRAPILIPELRA